MATYSLPTIIQIQFISEIHKLFRTGRPRNVENHSRNFEAQRIHPDDRRENRCIPSDEEKCAAFADHFEAAFTPAQLKEPGFHNHVVNYIDTHLPTITALI